MVFAGVIAAAVITWLLCRLAVGLGPRLGYVDHPDDPRLKVHQTPAVPLGGVAILAGMVAGWSMAGGVAWELAGLCVAIVLLGLADDRLGLPPLVRLAVEVSLAVVTLALGLVPLRLDAPIEAVVGVILIVVVVNAVNLLDGLDGLAGGTALVAFLGVALLSSVRGADPTLPLVISGALCGFLLLNRHPARVFLGDNGAYLIGMVLAVTSMGSAPRGLGRDLWITGLVLGVFLLDLAITVVRRSIAGVPLMAGDRSHTYDRLRDRGWSVPSVVMVAVAVQIAFVVLALGVERAV